MIKSAKLQIMWASVILITVLVLGFLGVYALQKSMTIKMTYTVSPNIRCQIEMKKTGEADYTPIFSNVSGHEYIAPNMSLNNGTSNLQINQNFSGGIGSSFMLKYINYTEAVVLTKVSGIGAMENAAVCGAYSNALPEPPEQEFEVASITGNVNLTFSFAEAITVQKVVTNCTITGETISYKNYQYIATINETTYLRDTILVEIGTNDYIVTTGVANQGITYNKTTGGIYIPATLIDDNIVITVIRGYKLQYIDEDGTTVFATRYCLGNTTYGANIMPTNPTKNGKTFQNWHGKNFVNEAELDDTSNYLQSGAYNLYRKYILDIKMGLNYTISVGNSNYVQSGYYSGNYYNIGITNWIYFTGAGVQHNGVYFAQGYLQWLTVNEVDFSSIPYTFFTQVCQDTRQGVTPSNNYYIAVYDDDWSRIPNFLTIINHIQIEYGTTATPFEAYRGVISSNTQILNCDHNVYAVWA